LAFAVVGAAARLTDFTGVLAAAMGSVAATFFTLAAIVAGTVPAAADLADG
jgi:hypothetical protein